MNRNSYGLTNFGSRHRKVMKEVSRNNSSPSLRILMFLTEGGLVYLVIQVHYIDLDKGLVYLTSFLDHHFCFDPFRSVHRS